MSDMEFFHGYYEKSDLKLEVLDEDTDEFYQLEEENNCHFVVVDGQLYKFWRSALDLDPYGFAVAFEHSQGSQLMLYWYNGGAGLHEVAEQAIRRSLTDKEADQ